MSKSLVAYFSATGTTAKLADTLAAAAGADLYEIKPEVPYTAADLNWMDKKSRSSIEMNEDVYKRQVITHTAFYAGWPKGWAVFNLAKEVWCENSSDADEKTTHAAR